MIKIKKKVQYVIVFIVFISIIIFEIIGNLEREKFHETALNNKVIEIKNNLTFGRSYDYVTDNKIIITLFQHKRLIIGDSIVKHMNSWNFKVYRKDYVTKKYKYYDNYKLEYIFD